MDDTRRTRLGRDYWKLWTASTISNLGDGTSQVAYPWLASLLTRDPLLVAGLTVALRLPWLLVSLPAGAIVDRGDRRRLMIGSNVLRAVLSLGLALAVVSDGASIWLLYAIGLAIGCAEVIHDNAAQTIVPRLVARERLERANGNLWAAETVANTFAGPPLGGLLIAIGVSLPFFLDAATFAVAASLVFVIGGMYRAGDTTPEAQPARRSLRAEIAEGFRWLWGHRLLRTLAASLGVMNMMTSLAMATFVLFAQEILGLDSASFGLLMTSMAVGGVLGSVLGPNITRRTGHGVALYACLVGGVVSGLGVGFTSSAYVVAALFALYSFTAILWNVITVSLRQSIIPDRLLGRVNSVYRFLGWGSIPVGALLGGIVVGVVEPLAGRTPALRAPYLVSAAVHLLLIALVGRRLSTGRIEQARSEST